MLLVCLSGFWGAGCRGELADDLRDLLGQHPGHGTGGTSTPGTCGNGGTGGAPAVDAGQPAPDAGQPAADGGGPVADGGQPATDGGSPSPGDIPAPRLIGPLSVSLGGSSSPAFKWELAAGTDGARLDFCKDPACQQITGGATFAGSSGKLSVPLQPGRVFWRAHGTAGGLVGTPASAVWELFVPDGTASGVTLAVQTRADFNRDGYTDFLLDGRALLGGPNGYSGTLMLPASPDGVTSHIYLVAGDLNGDGFTDVLRLDQRTNQTPMGLWTANVISGGPSGFTPGAVNETQFEGGPYSFGPAGDVNGDGYADVVFKTRYSAATFLGGPNGITTSAAPWADTSQSTFASDGDLNGDGYSDAASNSNGEQAIEQSFGSATGFGSGPTTVPAQVQIASLVMLEANGDQFSDVAFSSATGLQIFPGSSTGLAAAPLVTIAGDSGVAAIGTSQFNHDGFVDLIVNNDGTLEAHYGGGNGAPSQTGVPLVTPTQWKAGTFAGSFGDANGDGYDDFTVGVMPDTGGNGYNPASAVLHLGGPNGLDPTGTPAM